MSFKDLSAVIAGFLVSLIVGAAANKYPMYAIIELLGGTYPQD